MHTLINNRLLIKTAKCLMAVLMAGFVFSTPVSATETRASESALLDYSNKDQSKQKKNGSDYQPVDSWKPYYTWIGNVQDQDNKMFTQMTVGVGFLYFADSSANFNAIPANPNSVNVNVDIPLEGKIGYNRSPVFDFTVGYRIFNWMKMALAFEHQADVHVQTDSLRAAVVGTRISDASIPNAEFRANLGLNAMSFKVMFELPWPMIWKSWMYTPYFSASVGPGWQSWTDVRVYEQYLSGALETSFVNTLSQKYPASAFWQLDAGFRAKAATPSSLISFIVGCKFSSWGQTRNIGLQGQQGEWPYALFKPFRVKFLYSFVPYVGAQWNF